MLFIRYDDTFLILVTELPGKFLGTCNQQRKIVVSLLIIWIM